MGPGCSRNLPYVTVTLLESICSAVTIYPLTQLSNTSYMANYFITLHGLNEFWLSIFFLYIKCHKISTHDLIFQCHWKLTILLKHEAGFLNTFSFIFRLGNTLPARTDSFSGAIYNTPQWSSASSFSTYALSADRGCFKISLHVFWMPLRVIYIIDVCNQWTECGAFFFWALVKNSVNSSEILHFHSVCSLPVRKVRT